ncbi:biopolymer transporter ExbD [Roseobacter denitrificans]|uniref:Biopolymer transport protein ExbD/TolR n=1 Tax=Roseobacter denitrificans (strain ATCC 33942 / OCh 114) TaxID=375451 RepID=Q160F7_ROSDO|nr:biopolymer transporter ExbD [Roseobacter denitrificans]ABG33636.1 hypothetical protein RD1_4198 [Roseobacter denitrificans OCh 114]AVL52932.1 biopolymer transporter ExbD [Roseobacter denitrificans]SFG03287.1 biopolymer transport protein ExbD [Roseobacter denitrificans OCh 114]
MTRPATRRRLEPTIALINVVFLMLVFFLVAGAVAPPLDPDLTLATAADLEGRAPPDAMVLSADGNLTFRGQPTDAAAYFSTLEEPVARIVPDRDAPASALLDAALALQTAGAERIIVVAARGLE